MGAAAGLGVNREGLGAAGVASGAAEEDEEDEALASDGALGGLAVKALAKSAMFTFMLCSVVKVIFCTSIAWMVALSAVVFCSSQNSTDLSS